MVEIIKVIIFLLWINFMPPLANLIWKEAMNQPLDGNRLWFDGRPIFGSNKTIRGILAAIAGGATLLLLLGLQWWVGVVAAGLAMTGDLLTSFIKRRLHYAPGKPVGILDQLFEGLFPTLYLALFLNLVWWQILAIMLLFIPITLLGSRFWHFVIYRPEMKNYTRIIRSTVRLREWRACHMPVARWHTLLNFPNFIFHRIALTWIFKVSGLYEQGIRNSLDIRRQEETFILHSLPQEFDGMRILFLTDLHLDGLPGLTEVIIDRVKEMDVDICLIGGDVRMDVYGPVAPSLRLLRRLLVNIRARHGIYGVLGNHDCIELVPDFEEAGMLMLVNDAQSIVRNNETIWIIGIDDPNYYKVHNLEMAFRKVPDGAFTILIAHSPEAYDEAVPYQPHLYLCGHTHGGQIRLPGRGPIYTNSRAPRFTAAGRWHYKGIEGYTSRGVGASGVPLRFNCPGEISLITLRVA